jgi:predicted membrane chloride channel (bestrophin family)
LETILTAGITGFAGYVLAAFRKASKADLAELERRLDAKLRERQTLVIEPLKAQLALIEERLAVAVTNRELDAKFEAIGKRLDDIVALIARRPAE